MKSTKLSQYDLSAKNEIVEPKNNNAGGQIAKKVIIGKSENLSTLKPAQIHAVRQLVAIWLPAHCFNDVVQKPALM